MTCVFAVRTIPEGKVIQADDLCETKILTKRLPSGILPKEEGFGGKPYYVSSKIDGVGRLSLGITGAQLLVQKYPGFTGVILKE